MQPLLRAMVYSYDTYFGMTATAFFFLKMRQATSTWHSCTAGRPMPLASVYFPARSCIIYSLAAHKLGIGSLVL